MPTDIPEAFQLTELEQDLLRELLNVGVSKAADAFARLTHTKAAVVLTVPRLRFIQPADFEEEFGPYRDAELTIRTRLDGELEGLTLLFFRTDQIEWILHNMLTERELRNPGREALQEPLLLELTNILSGAVVTQLSDMIGLRVVGLPPEGLVTPPGESIADLLCQTPPCQPILLSVKTDLRELHASMELPLLLVFEPSALMAILNVIRGNGTDTLWLRGKR